MCVFAFVHLCMCVCLCLCSCVCLFFVCIFVAIALPPHEVLDPCSTWRCRFDNMRLCLGFFLGGSVCLCPAGARRCCCRCRHRRYTCSSPSDAHRSRRHHSPCTLSAVAGAPQVQGHAGLLACSKIEHQSHGFASCFYPALSCSTFRMPLPSTRLSDPLCLLNTAASMPSL